MLVPLAHAATATCGGKAGTLGRLLRAGLPVPDGVVVPFGADPAALHDALAPALDALGEPPVAVRSSAGDEDTPGASAAGQHETVLAVRGVDQVADAVRTCWASLDSARATAYRRATPGAAGEPVMAVLVQRLVDAQVAGVMFTPGAPDGTTRIEASWGLGAGVVGGTVTPDAYAVAADGTVARTVADKRSRTDRRGTQVVSTPVAAADRHRPCLDDTTAARLALLGRRVSEVLGGAQDVEWAVVDGEPWVLQARPVTADLPASASPPASRATLAGTPGSRGTATGTARVVRGPGDFARVRRGDVLVCPWTDPGWTPLLHLAAGVVTETGGVLAHAAIVARERGIPAVLGVPGATAVLHDGATVTVNGTAGTVTTVPHTPT
ncbi:PEP/pyruvate-binding domain-containing protein [Cellulomonas wangsupingiae]|uniref:PEP-utilizing enzyme n=1 Tax=Cellulomonas wangsupingiae TaxID=2968085 RepID=A0ABY5K4Q4_9CELL|nr:PEP/pyruvate-binding domain-containing protein [Cellulomonas wangsupingiae]MCC2334947.1 pyruvate, phosphate dikinase [Cellulomonas wangsupingiae]UUI65446.1 PEP-utilizing enzyme [Cellulomonas wangsupingiae]